MTAAASSRNSLAGLTLDDVLGNQKGAAPRSRTLLDIIREDESNKKDRKSWKAFKEKLRLKSAGSAWTSTIPIPVSDIPFPSLSQFSRRDSVRFHTPSNSNASTRYMAHKPDDVIDPDAPAPISRAQFSRRSSTRYGSPVDASFPVDASESAQKLRPQMSRRNSTRLPSHAESFRRERVVTFRDSFGSDDDGSDEDGNPEAGRALSAREAVAAQEAAEAAAAAAEEEERSRDKEEEGPAGMSLMDLLEEMDRQMGLEGPRYRISDDEDEEDEEGDENGEEEGGAEYNCCMCMVRHTGAAFMACGHTYCRMCSKELSVSKANCPLCNNFILEILDIF